jgi:hypothetical protein
MWQTVSLNLRMAELLRNADHEHPQEINTAESQAE